MAAGSEDRVDLIMSRQKALRLPRGFEAAHDLLPFSRRPVAALDPVVQALVRPVIGLWSKVQDWLDVAAELVGDHNSVNSTLGSP
jgi:hypothetical protein